MASGASFTEDVFPPGLPARVKDFIRDKCLQKDFQKYYEAIESSFPDARLLSFRLTDDPEIENVRYIEATIEVEPNVEKAADAYDLFLKIFSADVSHDNHHYFALTMDFADQG